MAALILDGLVVGALLIYIFYQSQTKRSHLAWRARYGPTILVFFAWILIIIDPLRHVLHDKGIWEGCTRSCGQTWPESCWFAPDMYECDIGCYFYGTSWAADELDYTCDNVDKNQKFSSCDSGCVSSSNISHLSAIQWIFTVATYVGFILLTVGSLWNANIVDQCRAFKRRWRELRNGDKVLEEQEAEREKDRIIEERTVNMGDTTAIGDGNHYQSSDLAIETDNAVAL